MGTPASRHEAPLSPIARPSQWTRARFRSLIQAVFIYSLFLVALTALGETTPEPQSTLRDRPSCTLSIDVDGIITPGTLRELEDGFSEADRKSCASILLLINSPGGNLQTTRMIVEKILASPRPILCLVSPSGGHAGSAGAIILMACHVNGAEPATNLGAATPVSLGQSLPDDIRKKVIADTVSWVQGLARLRGRDLIFAEKIVTEASAVDAEEAVRKGAIDFLAPDTSSFLDQAQGRQVAMAGGRTAVVQVGALVPYQSNARNAFLKFITDPEIAYLLFMASLGLLFFELTHPGTIVPGVTGALGLILSLMAFHKLEVTWGSLALIVAGLIMLIAEAFVPSFGALGIGGIVAVATGSFLLFDPAVTGTRLSLSVIIATSVVLGAILLGLGFFAVRTWRLGRTRPDSPLVGKVGQVASLLSPSRRRGMVIVAGEYWRFESDKDVSIGDSVEVVKQDNLVLKVKS